ncbi:GDSL-type esterase/lipase family protein [Cuneatibacter caecimuris]|uniref:Lysophospholipase L1-like esterase n=1 Tax=Cuneatibacter caecimuris TaxID=1796618 RepID=A0A4Q7PKI6_9FIRM|nr:GDSL-type esterase/lipase family protein [Cuneatibacter caecimuris]RZT01241.1 lysophospholipase L1-like esterase [Cuneatibacter caecimuris]
MTREERKKREKRRRMLVYSALGTAAVCVLCAVIALAGSSLFPGNVSAATGGSTKEEQSVAGTSDEDSSDMMGFRPSRDHMQGSKAVNAFVAPTAEEVEQFWSDTAFVGDSIIAGFGLYLRGSGQQMLGNPTIIALTGYSLNDALLPAGRVSHPIYQGQEHTIFEALALRQPSRIVLSFGINDLGMNSVAQIVSNYDTTIKRIRQICPDAEIYVVSCTYVFKGREGGNRTNANIRELNRRMEQYGEENQVGFINLAPYLADENGCLYSGYTTDFYVHQNDNAYRTWVQVLRRYAYWQICGEEAPDSMFPITVPAAVPAGQIPSGTVNYQPPEFTEAHTQPRTTEAVHTQPSSEAALPSETETVPSGENGTERQTDEVKASAEPTSEKKPSSEEDRPSAPQSSAGDAAGSTPAQAAGESEAAKPSK